MSFPEREFLVGWDSAASRPQGNPPAGNKHVSGVQESWRAPNRELRFLQGTWLREERVSGGFEHAEI
jgi:hypothetical protein